MVEKTKGLESTISKHVTLYLKFRSEIFPSTILSNQNHFGCWLTTLQNGLESCWKAIYFESLFSFHGCHSSLQMSQTGLIFPYTIFWTLSYGSFLSCNYPSIQVIKLRLKHLLTSFCCNSVELEYAYAYPLKCLYIALLTRDYFYFPSYGYNRITYILK